MKNLNSHCKVQERLKMLVNEDDLKIQHVVFFVAAKHSKSKQLKQKKKYISGNKWILHQLTLCQQSKKLF